MKGARGKQNQKTRRAFYMRNVSGHSERKAMSRSLSSRMYSVPCEPCRYTAVIRSPLFLDCRLYCFADGAHFILFEIAYHGCLYLEFSSSRRLAIPSMMKA